MTTAGRFTRMRLLWPDHLGLARGKYLPMALAEQGTGFCVTTFAMSYDRELIDAPGAYLLEGLKDVRGVPDPASIRPSWESDQACVAVADLTLGEGPYAVSSRAALQRALARWADIGYQIKVGIELEGYLLAPTAQDPSARSVNPRAMVYGTGALGDPTGFLSEVLDTADRCGFVVESANVEFDESQFEFTLRYDDALRAVDDAFLFRVMVREVAIARGLDFTFLGKPFPTVSGSGVHTNFSLVDAEGINATFDATDEHGLSAVARGCVAGLAAHHRALTALSAPTVNAYRRLRPGTLAGCFANWGVDHRNVATRIPAEQGSAMRIESRLGDGSMNLHLGVAALLEAARLGVVGGLQTPPAYTSDGFADGGGAPRSATDLGAALDDLEADAELLAAMDSELIANFVANKRHEYDRFVKTGDSIDGDTLTSFERTHYLPYH